MLLTTTFDTFNCAAVLQQLDPTISNYFDRRFPTAPNASDEQKKQDFDIALRTSTTVYIGNLAFTTSDFQLYEVHIACLSICELADLACY